MKKTTKKMIFVSVAIAVTALLCTLLMQTIMDTVQAPRGHRGDVVINSERIV